MSAVDISRVSNSHSRGRSDTHELSKKRKAKRKETTLIYRPLTDSLHDLISTHRQVVTSYRPDKWDDAFRKLVEIDGVSLEDVQKTLTAYALVFGEEYIPVAWSAKSFREKYGRIVNALTRGSQKKSRRRTTGSSVSHEDTPAGGW